MQELSFYLDAGRHSHDFLSEAAHSHVLSADNSPPRLTHR